MSETTRNQYEILGELRRADEKILRLRRGLAEIPEEMAKLDAALTERHTLFDTAKTNLEAAEKRLRSIEMDLKEREANIDKAAARMMEVKTNEEYQAALKENEGRKQEKTKLEEQVLQLLSEVEGLRRELKEREKEFKGYETATQGDKQRLEEERDRLQRHLDELLQKREVAAARLDGNLAATYMRVASSGAVAVAVVENGVCLGCRTKVRPQLYNEVLGYKAVHRCPSCGRILIGPSHGEAASSVADDLNLK